MIDPSSITKHIKLKKNDLAKYSGVEDAIASYFRTRGYDCIAEENHCISSLWGLICLEPILWTPSWSNWDKTKSPVDYPELLKYSTNHNIKLWEESRHVSLEWIYSKQCFDSNGYPITLPDGCHYMLFEDKINHFIEELSLDTIKDTIIKNDFYVRYEMAKEYARLPRVLMTYPWNFSSQIGDDQIQCLTKLAKVLPLDAIKFICKRFFKNWHEYRTGFPDLWLLNEAGNLLLVEVKKPREQIRENQMYWISKLIELGVSVQIVRVHSLA